MARILGATVGVLIVWTSLAGSGQPAGCNGHRYLVRGAVRDTAGGAVPNAQVYILMDKVSEKKFLEQGMRARSFRADDSGRYAATVVCEEANGLPNPCAKNPKYLTVAASGPNHGLKLMVFKLKDLPVTSLGGECLVDAPGIVLRSPL